jgi:F-type H+-transporting ATPase subunit delta
MKDRSLATRYARALLAALPADRAEEADEFLRALAEGLRSSAEFRDLLLDPAVQRSARTEALVDLARRNDQAPQLVNFLRTLVDNNRAAALPAIAEVFREERERAAGIQAAEITSAAPLGEELERRARLALERATGKRIRLSVRVDPALIGGAVTRVGSRVYDGSLRTQLGRMRQKMTQE